MPRQGVNPLKGTKLDGGIPHRPVTVCTIVYIPSLLGYWEASLDVLKTCFASLFQNTSLPFNFMVLDNGSCPEVQDFLLDCYRLGQIQYLNFSQNNLKKLGGLNYLLSVAPGDFVAFADSDVYFLPGWLEKSMEVFQAFPEAGWVTAFPRVQGDMTQYQIFPAIAAASEINMETGSLIPNEYIAAHRMSIGATVDGYQHWHRDRKDVRLTRNSVRAFLGGTDFQFVITRQTIEKVLPLRLASPEEMGDTVYTPLIERRMRELGIWELSTVEYLVHHMGNAIPELSAELPWVSDFIKGQPLSEPNAFTEKSKPKNSLLATLARKKRIRRFLKRVYLRSYQLLYEGN